MQYINGLDFTLSVFPSKDPEKPLTLSLRSTKPDEDLARVGVGLDLTLDDAERLATLVHEGLRLIRTGVWRTA